MSIDLVAAALWLPMEGNRKLVLIGLCERADLATGKCWPGREELAVRSSLTVRRVTPHLQGLEADGWCRSRRGNFRRGETTTRWLNVKRILEDGEAARQAFLATRLATLEDETSPDQLALTLGDDEGIDQGTFGNDQGTVATSLGDAVTLVTVIEPSDQPSDQPSTAGAAAGDGDRATFLSSIEKRSTGASAPLFRELAQSGIEARGVLLAIKPATPRLEQALRSGAFVAAVKVHAQMAGFEGFVLQSA